MKNRKTAGDELVRLIGEDNVRFIPAALFVLALLLRLFFAPAGLLHTDSVIAAQAAEGTVRTGQLHYLQGLLGYPGYAVVNSVIFFIYHAVTGAPSAERILIFSSAAFGALSVALTYVLARRLTGSMYAGIFSALVLCFMPLHLSLSTYVKDQVLGSCVLLLAALAAMKAGQSKDMRYTVLTGALLGYAMAIRQQEILFLPTLALFYYLEETPLSLRRAKGRLKLIFNESPKRVFTDMFIIGAAAAAVFVLFYTPKMFYQPGFSLIDAILATSGESSAGFSLFSPQLSASLGWMTMTLTQAGWLLLAFSIYVNYARGRKAWFTLVFWMVTYFMFYGNLMGASPYFFFQALLPVSLMMGWGLEYIHSRWQKASILLLAALMFMMLLNIAPLLESRKARCGPCEFAKKIGEVTPEYSAIIGMDETRHYEYYGGRMATMGHPSAGDESGMAKHMNLLHEMLRNGTSVYITTAGLSYDYLPQGLLVLDQDRKLLANRQTQAAYDHLMFDAQTQSLWDRDTNLRIPSIGLYGLELFNEFRITPVFSMENEDWHHHDLESAAYTATLYRIEERTPSVGNATVALNVTA